MSEVRLWFVSSHGDRYRVTATVSLGTAGYVCGWPEMCHPGEPETVTVTCVEDADGRECSPLWSERDRLRLWRECVAEATEQVNERRAEV